MQPIVIRSARPADYPAIRDVLVAANEEYRTALPPGALDLYLTDLVEVGARAELGHVLVAEHDGEIAATATYYRQARSRGIEWPTDWAGVRAVAVHPDRRRLGLASAIMHHCAQRAFRAGAPALCLHTTRFMQSAVSLYERLGFVRTPEFDFDVASVLGSAAREPLRIIAYMRLLETGTVEAQAA